MRACYYVNKDLRPGKGWSLSREMKHIHTVPTRELAETIARELAQSEWEQYGRPTAVRIQAEQGWRQIARFGHWAQVPPVFTAVAA